MALLVLGSLPADARIGDSPQGCELRYGKPVRVSENGDLATYRRGYLSVVVHFTAGTADMLSYRKLPIPGYDTHQPAPPFGSEEIRTLLTDNAGKATWVDAGSSEKSQAWALEDGSLFAFWDHVTDSLTIYSGKFAASTQG